MTGWIKLHRKIIDSRIYQKPPLYLRVFERLILEANHTDQEIPYGNGTKLIKRGERLTSIQQICEWVGWYERGVFKTPNKKTVKTILDWLESEGMIEVMRRSDNESNGKGNYAATHYKIVNYDIYQDKEQDESNGQSNDQSNGKVTHGKRKMDTNKNEKNEKNNLKNIYAEQVQQVFDFYLKTFDGFFKTYSLTADRKSKIEARLKEGYTVEQICTAIRNIRQSPFHCGENDRHKFYADIAFICRSGSKVEEWINYVPNGNSIAGNMPVIDYEAAKKSKYGW